MAEEEEKIVHFTFFEDQYAQWQDWSMVLRMKWCRLTIDQGGRL